MSTCKYSEITLETFYTALKSGIPFTLLFTPIKLSEDLRLELDIWS